MPQRSRSPARLLAPLALAATILAVVVLAGAGLGGGDSTDQGSSTPPVTAPKKTKTAAAKQTATKKAQSDTRSSTYTVKTGDTPGSIAEGVGITVDRLLELNPDLDPNALVAGQKIKLSE